MKKNNPISFLEDSFLSIKEYLEGEMNPKKPFFDEKFILQLKVETTSLLSLCETLNADQKIIKALNALINQNNTKEIQYKAEHFFLSDLITVYNQQSAKEDEKARFVLAYYFDVLKNHQFADANAIQTLNRLVANPDFKANLDHIRKQNVLHSIDQKSNQSFLITALSQTKSDKLQQTLEAMNNFATLAFNLSFDKAALDQIVASAQSKEKNSAVNNLPDNDSLEKVLEELHQLVGLEKVKNDVKELINLLEIQKRRDSEGLKNIDITLHTVFLGPPGTGKTSVARLLSRIYKHLGFLSKGQLYETDREGMIAGYVGQTATKVDKVVQESLGGVLFIDEAYALTQNLMGNDYGAEAVNTLLKRMEDHRDDLSVVVAGYTEPMKIFVESNPGLRSRFNRFFYFDHFTAEQLYQIFETFCKQSDFIIDESAKEKLEDTFDLLVDQKDDSFGNARVVRNLFEKCVQNQANRIIKLTKISKKTLKTFTEEDIPEPKDTQEQVSFSVDKK
ncbi:AAA family ATPase [Flavobacterium sp. IMCC34852]|uniref:AAA family ATPase n=1 Tax=Flavobacterium rivulicola TaxID=2732161 RepID=A0A7Y3R7K7_9FLAO|nr:AAA family ATPase [Flavobacterium sp. IMCC34852]NNT71016.1 AAA family ATPase [Flavobacterium sp. IMCC34852]